MTNIPTRDYGRWKLPHLDWPSVEAFLKEGRWKDGIHTVQLSSGPSVDIMFEGQPFEADHASVPVFFSGAVQNRETKSGPFFSGNNVSLSGGFPYISISDPSLELDQALGLAWYAGSEDQSLPGQLLTILAAFADASERELLLIGGSGGGYAALFYGQCLGSLASVLVWNAQTDILEYNEKFVKHYLSAAFPRDTKIHLDSPDWKRKVRRVLAESAVELSILAGAKTGRKPRRSVFIQNATDWHVPVHAAPFVEASQYKHRGRGLHLADQDHALWITHYGADHAPLSPAGVTSLVKDMLDPRRTALEVVVSFRNSGLVPNQRPGLEPRDLRHLKGVIEGQLSLSVEVQNEEMLATVVLRDVPAGYGGIRFGFFEETPDGKSSNVKWYSEETECRIPRREKDSCSMILVRVRDGFNNELFSLNQGISLEQGDEGVLQSASAKKRFFVYGSCVSRDAFALNHEFKLVDYIARSPLGSAFASPPNEVSIHFDSIPSEFQRRMAYTDVSKNLEPLLREASFDYLLVDLIDERLQVMQYQDTVITYSAEIQRAGIHANASELAHIGSKTFYSRWKAGFERLISVCAPEKIIINKVFWATIADDGTKLPNQEDIAANNSILRSLYADIALTEGIKFIEYPPHLLVADSKHKWGPAPYHFIEEASVFLLQELAGQRNRKSRAS